MKKFIERLPEAQAKTIFYHIYGGLKYQEIADTMGVSLITVKTRMRKAKDSLKVMIAEYEQKTGVQLHSVAPIPLIAFFLRMYMEESKMPMSIDFKTFNQIRKYIDESVSVLRRYIEAFKQTNGIKELVVGIVAASVVGAGTVEVIFHNLPTFPEPIVIEEEKEEETEQEEEQFLPMFTKATTMKTQCMAR